MIEKNTDADTGKLEQRRYPRASGFTLVRAAWPGDGWLRYPHQEEGGL